MKTTASGMPAAWRLHRDPELGAPFFLGRPHDQSPTIDDLLSRPWQDFVPRKTLRERELVLLESAASSGVPLCIAYTTRGFEANFVEPFVRSLGQDREAFSAPWLYVGPTGPHAIGIWADTCSRLIARQPAYCVGMDPRWLLKQDSEGARERYLDHVVEEALAILGRRSVGVITATPLLLARIGRALPGDRCADIQALCWGGAPADREDIRQLSRRFPQACIRGVFAKSLIGLFPQVGAQDGQPVFGYRGGSQFYRVVDEEGTPVGEGERGLLVAGRIDDSLFLVGVRSGNQARHCQADDGSPAFLIEASVPGGAGSNSDPSPAERHI